MMRRVRKFSTAEGFREAAQSGHTRGLGVRREQPSPMIDLGGRRVRFCFSDGTVDRMGDTILATGWDYYNFGRNPVALWAHDSSQPPIGRASNLAIEGGRLMGDITFIEREIYPFADDVFQMVRAGYINAVSVGFLPIEYEFSDDRDRPGGIDFIRQELLEISVVPVPANPAALHSNAMRGAAGMERRGFATANDVGTSVRRRVTALMAKLVDLEIEEADQHAHDERARKRMLGIRLQEEDW